MKLSAEDYVISVRFHARGGQGGVTASQLCVDSFDGFGVNQPRFGAERMGSPTESYARMSKNKTLVRTNEQVYTPNYVGVLDDSLLVKIRKELTELIRVAPIHHGIDSDYTKGLVRGLEDGIIGIDILKQNTIKTDRNVHFPSNRS